MVYRVTYYGESILREKGETIESFDEEFKSVVSNMIETIESEDSIGIAAQQIGKALQVCIIDWREILDRDEVVSCNYELDGKKVPLQMLFPIVFVNPKLEYIGQEQEIKREACMSFPGVYGPVIRYQQVKLTYQDVDGNPHELIADGFFARAIQHEVDHVNGVLMIDRMDPRAVGGIKSKLKQLKRYTKERLRKLEQSD